MVAASSSGSSRRGWILVCVEGGAVGGVGGGVGEERRGEERASE